MCLLCEKNTLKFPGMMMFSVKMSFMLVKVWQISNWNNLYKQSV